MGIGYSARQTSLVLIHQMREISTGVAILH